MENNSRKEDIELIAAKYEFDFAQSVVGEKKCVMFRGDFQGKYGHRAALKSPIVSRTGQTTPRRFVVFG